MLQLYRSLQEDGEVRIAAYQQLMRCPDQEVLQVVKRTLSKETSSQGMTHENVRLKTHGGLLSLWTNKYRADWIGLSYRFCILLCI